MNFNVLVLHDRIEPNFSTTMFFKHSADKNFNKYIYLLGLHDRIRVKYPLLMYFLFKRGLNLLMNFHHVAMQTCGSG